jgi:hypothetical protein
MSSAANYASFGATYYSMVGKPEKTPTTGIIDLLMIATKPQNLRHALGMHPFPRIVLAME